MKKLKIFLISMLLLIMPLCAFAEEMVSELDKLSPNIKKGDNNTLVLTWDNNEEISEYQIFRSTKKTSGFKKITTVNEDIFIDTKLTYGTTYYYKVIGVKEDENVTSEVISKKVTPNKVENVKLTAGDKQIKITYDKTSNTGYEIYRSTDNKKWTKVTTISKTKTTNYTNKKLSTNKTYYYKVRAYSKVKGKKIYGSFSEVVSVKTAPSAPSINAKATAYDEIDVTIKKASGATYYEVQRSTNKKNGFKTIGSTESLIFNDEDINPTVTYYYKVRACNSNSTCGSYSKIYGKKTSISKPTLKGSTLSSNVNINWNEISYADGYELSYSIYKNKKFSTISNAKVLEFNKENLIPGKTYYFRVRTYVIKNSKKYYSSYSNLLSLKPSVKQVTNLNLLVNGTKVTLNYKYPYYDERLVFQIQRSTSKKGKYITVSSVNTNEAHKEGNNYVFYEKNLNENRTYYYKIRALIKISNKTYYGSFSDIKSIKTSNKLPDYEGVLSLASKEKDNISDRVQLRNILSENGFDITEIEYAITNADINWNNLALGYANTLLSYSLSNFEMTNLLKERMFTKDEIEYTFEQLNLDYKKIAYNRAKKEYNNYSENELNEYLINRGFTLEEIEYAFDNIKLEYKIGYVDRQNGNMINKQDVIRLGEELFYVVSSNQNETVLLSKYDLNRETKMQDNSGSGYKILRTKFADSAYWNGKVGDNLTYPGQYCTPSYMNNCTYVYDEHSSIYDIINNYAETISNEINIEVTGRLLSVEEALMLDNSISRDMNNSGYWLGNPTNDTSYIFYVIANGNSDIKLFCLATFYSDENYGVRPVIIIPTNAIINQENQGIDDNEQFSLFKNNVNKIYNIAQNQFTSDINSFKENKLTYGNMNCYDKELLITEDELLNYKYNITITKDGKITRYKVTNGTYYYDSLDVPELFLSDIVVYRDASHFEIDTCSFKENIIFVRKHYLGKITIEDEISINNEHFYVIDSNESKTTLLAKYDLKQGENGTIMQDTSGTNTYIIKNLFSNTNYWYNNGLINPYNNDQNIIGTKAFNKPYPYVYDNNSNLYTLVNAYVNKIENDNNVQVSSRLMSYEEFEKLSNNVRKDMNSYYYWLGSAANSGRIYYGTSDGRCGYVDNYAYAIRPIIEISTSDLLN